MANKGRARRRRERRERRQLSRARWRWIISGAALGMVAAMVCVWTLGKDIPTSATQWATFYGSMFAGALAGIGVAMLSGDQVRRWRVRRRAAAG